MDLTQAARAAAEEYLPLIDYPPIEMNQPRSVQINQISLQKHSAESRAKERSRIEAAILKHVAPLLEGESVSAKNGRTVVKVCVCCGMEFARFAVESQMDCCACRRKRLLDELTALTAYADQLLGECERVRKEGPILEYNERLDIHVECCRCCECPLPDHHGDCPHAKPLPEVPG